MKSCFFPNPQSRQNIFQTNCNLPNSQQTGNSNKFRTLYLYLGHYLHSCCSAAGQYHCCLNWKCQYRLLAVLPYLQDSHLVDLFDLCYVSLRLRQAKMLSSSAHAIFYGVTSITKCQSLQQKSQVYSDVNFCDQD